MKQIIRLRRTWVILRQWVSSHRKTTLIIGTVIVICIGGIITYVVMSQKPAPVVATTPKATDKPAVKTPAVKYYSPLTGTLVANEAATKKPVTGVMIENSPDARPQSGLKNSGVVFEAIAEGGITRFLVLYQIEKQEDKPQLIGPVRSVRLYDAEWLAAFNAGLAHVGGSLYALNEVRNGSYRDLDQFFNPDSYWRSDDRWAPHNVYTSFANLDTLNTAKGYTTSTFVGFTRIDGKASSKPIATSIDITISSFLYNSSYVYSAKTNTYARYQAGASHDDRESGQITPSVVVAMYVDETTVLEDGYRESITTIGNGKAVIFQNGTATDATWHKTSKTSQITFTNAAGKDVPLVRGQTWITAVPNGEGDATWK